VSVSPEDFRPGLLQAGMLRFDDFAHESAHVFAGAH